MPLDPQQRRPLRLKASVALSILVPLAVLAVAPHSLAAQRATGSAPAVEPEPIEGVWAFQGTYPFKVDVTAKGDDSFIGTVLESPIECLPVGLEIWHMEGSGTSYTGTHYSYKTEFGACVEGEQIPTTFVTDDLGALMSVCRIDNRSCSYYQAQVIVIVSAPEFVERAERFEVVVEIRGADTCGDRVSVLKRVAGDYGIVKTVAITASCQTTIKVRLRKDAEFKARLKGKPETDSKPITVKVR